MTKSHSHAAKKPRGSHSGHSVHPPSSPIGPDTDVPANWPSQVLEMMMTPWRTLTPMELWIEKWRAGGTSAFPRSESKETENAYIYAIELPGISHDQVALSFHNGIIMLRIEEAEDQRKHPYLYHHSRSIRRSFSLPVYTNGEAITATLKDGLLTIIIPKSDKPVIPKHRTIDIT